MVIVEGPDGSGKTTLVSKICTLFDVEVRPRACTSDNAVNPFTLREWVEEDIEDLRRRPHGKVLCDRYPLISEPIYGPLIRGRMANGFADVNWLRTYLNVLEHDLHSFVVFCLPPETEVLLNVMESHKATTDHLQGVRDQIQAIYEQYTYVAALWQGRSVVWDYTRGDLQLVMEEIEVSL